MQSSRAIRLRNASWRCATVRMTVSTSVMAVTLSALARMRWRLGFTAPADATALPMLRSSAAAAVDMLLPPSSCRMAATWRVRCACALSPSSSSPSASEGGGPAAASASRAFGRVDRLSPVRVL